MRTTKRPRRLLAGLALAAAALLCGTMVPAQAGAPPDAANAKPGTVLDSRPVTIAAGSLIPMKLQAWQLRYRTTDALGKATTALTTVILPANAKPDKNRPLVAYDSFEDSIPENCAPSYQLQQNLNWDSAPVQLELIFIAAAARQGYAVTVPDHLGPKGEYLAGDMSGHATLDAIRATENFEPAGLNGAATRTGVYGYSGGSQAAEFAGTLQGSYAPELNIVGISAGGVPADIKKVKEKTNKTPFAGIPVNGIASLTNAYPELKRYVDEHLTDKGKNALDKARKQCLQYSILQNIGTDVDTFFNVQDPLDKPIPAKYLAKVKMSGEVEIKAPMYVFQAVHDEIVPSEPVDELVRKQCAAGNDITYRRDMISDHFTLGATGFAEGFRWLSDRLDGKPAKSGCDTRTVPSTLATPENLAFFGKTLIDSLIDVAGRPVGPGSFPK